MNRLLAQLGLVAPGGPLNGKNFHKAVTVWPDWDNSLCSRTQNLVLEWARRAGVPEESGGAYAIRSLDSGRGKDACEDLNKPYNVMIVCVWSHHKCHLLHSPRSN